MVMVKEKHRFDPCAGNGNGNDILIRNQQGVVTFSD